MNVVTLCPISDLSLLSLSLSLFHLLSLSLTDRQTHIHLEERREEEETMAENEYEETFHFATLKLYTFE